MNELNKLYKAMLLSFGAVIKDDGRIVYGYDDQEHPIAIDGMNLYAPYSEVLASNCVGKVFFHPACENITSKETEVFKIIRRMTGMKLLDTFTKLPPVVIKAANSKEKKGWTQNVLDMLEPLRKVTRPIQEEVRNIFKMMTVEPSENGIDCRFIHFRINKGGNGRSSGERVYYKTKPTFPFYNELVKRVSRTDGENDNYQVELNGSTFSRLALKSAVHLFQSILPVVISHDDNEFEATNAIAARLVSYSLSYADVAEQMNRIRNIFRQEFDKIGVYHIDTDWIELLDNISEIYRQVPVLDYNSHNTKEEEVDQTSNNVSGLFNLSGTNNNQQQQNSANNNGQQQQYSALPNGVTLFVDGFHSTNPGRFDVSRPVLNPGHTWTGRVDIDTNRNIVVHHAISHGHGAVQYTCSHAGNLLTIQENNGQGNMLNNLLNINNGMMNPMNTGLLNPQGVTNVNNLNPFQQALLYQQQSQNQMSMMDPRTQLINMLMNGGVPGTATATSSMNSAQQSGGSIADMLVGNV